MVGALIGRYELHEPMLEFIDKSGIPFTSMFMAKGTLSETHPNFIGVYNGRILDEKVQKPLNPLIWWSASVLSAQTSTQVRLP